MAKKVILKDLNDNEILPITRGELIIDSSGKEAFHSNEFLATQSLPGLMSKEDKTKLNSLANTIIDTALSTTSTNPVQNKVVTKAINEALDAAENAQETADNALQIANSIKANYLKEAIVNNNTLTIVDLDNNEIDFENTTYPIVSNTEVGLAPKIGTSTSETISNLTNEWVLTSTKGGSPTWRKLPTNAFKNDNSNTTYTLDGGIESNKYIVKLTDSNNSSTTASIEIMSGATSSTDGLIGLVPKPIAGNLNKYLKGDGSWDTPLNDKVTLTNTTTSADYRVLFSENANDTTSTEGARKSSKLKFNPSTGTLTATTFNGNLDWSKITNKPSSFTPSTHYHPTSQINALTEYSKAEEASDLTTTDTLNTALGKLEYKADTAYDWIVGVTTPDTDKYINKWQEILDFLNKVDDTDGADITDEFVTRKTTQTVTGAKIFSKAVTSTVADGTAPFIITSGTLVTNLNSDKLDGFHASGLFLSLSNIASTDTSNPNTIAIKIGGTTKYLKVGYATKAESLVNKLILKIKSGTTEGTDLYTYDGSNAKTLDIKAGSNITLGTSAGVLTISSTNTNTTYTLSGALSGNTFVTTLTPSSGDATKATIPAMTGATSSAAGKAGLVPAPESGKNTSFLKGDGTWAIPLDTKVTSVDNHYTPETDSNKTLGATASSTTAATWGSTDLVTGIKLTRDAKGHVTGVTVDSIQLPSNPNVNTWRPVMVNGTEVATSTTGTGTLNLKSGTGITVSGTKVNDITIINAGVRSVTIGTGDNDTKLAVNTNGTTNYLTIPYATLAAKVTCTASTDDIDRPIVLTNTSNSLYYSTKATINYSTGHIKAGALTSTGQITLYSSSGDSPHLYFLRGTTSDGTYDWDQYVTGGYMKFRYNNAGTWTEVLSLYPGNSTLDGYKILHAGNSSVSGEGGSTWGSSITVKINGVTKTLTIPANPLSSIKTLTFSAGTFAAKTYNGSADVTVNVPSNFNHIGDAANLYVDAGTVKRRIIVQNTKNSLGYISRASIGLSNPANQFSPVIIGVGTNDGGTTFTDYYFHPGGSITDSKGNTYAKTSQIPTIPSLSLGTTTGSGNAVTSITVSGHTITLNKGTTFSVSGHTHSYLTSGATLSGSTHAAALKTYFTNNYSSIPRNSLNTYYSSAYSNGSLYFGYFLSGYNDTPYGGFYVAHYNTPYYVGVMSGTFTLYELAKVGHSHSTLTFLSGTFSAQTYNGTAAKTVNVPTTGAHVGLGNVLNTAFYKRSTSVNGTAWDMAGTVNSAAFTIFAPTTAGTSDYVLKSNGSGAPTWIALSSIAAGSAGYTYYLAASSTSNVNTPNWKNSGISVDLFNSSASNKPYAGNNANGVINFSFGKHGTSSYYGFLLALGNGSDRLYFRQATGGSSTTSSFTAWKTIAYTSDIPSVGNGTITITQGGTTKGSFTVNLSGATTIALTDTNTDTKVTNTLATTTKFYVTGTSSASTNTGTQYFDTGVYVGTTAGLLYATYHSSPTTLYVDSASGCSIIFRIGGTEAARFALPNGNLTLAANRQILRGGASVSWYLGRAYAMLYQNTYTGYNPCVAMKTTNGSWTLGVYSSDTAYMTYVTDSNYNSGNNVATYNIAFPKASGTLALTSLIPTVPVVTNYYWANVKVSASSSTSTSPTFATATMTRGVVGGYNNTSYALSTATFICLSWVRTTGSTGWYNESYGGGWYMIDSTYVRVYNNKHIYTTGNSYVTSYYSKSVAVLGFCTTAGDWTGGAANSVVVGANYLGHIRTSGDNLYHYHWTNGANYKILDENNIGPRVKYWAVYQVFIGSGSGCTITKKAGNYNFVSSYSREAGGRALVTASYPSGWSEDTTFIFGNGSVSNTSDYTKPCILTVQKEHSSLRLILSDDASVEDRAAYAWLYFLCIG